MALESSCQNCGADVIVRFLKMGETAKSTSRQLLCMPSVPPVILVTYVTKVIDNESLL